jgi:hypothetical protein
MIILLYIILVIVVLVTFLAVLAPKTYDVNRSVIINKPLTEVFYFLKYLKNQSHWSPWEEKDPNMKKEFFGTDGEVGFISKWEGNKDVGVGEQEIKAIVNNEIVNTELRFYKPWKSESDAYLKVEKVDENSTKVVWGFSGYNKFPMSIMMIFMSMDKMIGKDFEYGLSKLKLYFDK